jgi:hypothetical protein
MRSLKYLGGIGLAIGIMLGITRQPVIDASPEPLKTGLQRIRLDMDKVMAGSGWDVKKKPGSGNNSGGDGGIPLFKSHGVPN